MIRRHGQPDSMAWCSRTMKNYNNSTRIGWWGVTTRRNRNAGMDNNSSRSTKTQEEAGWTTDEENEWARRWHKKKKKHEMKDRGWLLSKKTRGWMTSTMNDTTAAKQDNGRGCAHEEQEDKGEDEQRARWMNAIHHFYYGLKAVQRTTVRP